MDTAKVSIAKLNGENYLIWSTQLEALLHARGLCKHVGPETIADTERVSGVTTAPVIEQSDTIAKEKSTVRATILCTIEPEYISMVAGDTDPRVMWRKLSDANKSKCQASLYTLRNNLLNMSMMHGETVLEYVNRICTIERQLSFAGKVTDDSDKKYALLNGLRSEFEMKKTILMEYHDMSFERMVASLEQTEESVSKSKSGASSRLAGGTAFVSTMQTTRRKGSCSVCEKSGHRMNGCFYNPKSRRYKPTLKRTSEITANLKKRKLLSGDDNNESSARGHECEFTFMVKRAEDILHRWFFDSCSSRHLCNNKDHLIDYTNLQESEYVDAACEGASVRVVGIGNLRVSQRINGVETTTFLDAHGVLIDPIPPYSPQSNGRAERANRTILEKARTILSELNMICSLEGYKSLWPEALRCAVYVYNRTLTRSTHKSERGRTPFEIVSGEKPDISNLRIFGTKVKVLKPKPYQGSKVESKTWNGVHVGYNPGDAYRAYIPELGRVFVSKDVTFLEKLYRVSDHNTVSTKESSNESGSVPANDTKGVEEDDYNIVEGEDKKHPPWIYSSDNEIEKEKPIDITESVDIGDESSIRTRSGRVSYPTERYGFSSLHL